DAAYHRYPPPIPTRRSSDLRLDLLALTGVQRAAEAHRAHRDPLEMLPAARQHQQPALAREQVERRQQPVLARAQLQRLAAAQERSEEHTSELQSRENLVCRL